MAYPTPGRKPNFNADGTVNPDAGGIGGLFSSTWNWVDENAGNIFGVIGQAYAADRMADLERERIRANAKRYQTQTAPTNKVPGGGYATPGGVSLPVILAGGALVVAAIAFARG